jgi:transposase
MESGGGQAQVTPGFQQAESNISEGADTVGEGFAEQAAFLYQLKDQMGNLEQEIKHLASVAILGVGVFEIVAAIFLDIEAFRMKLRSRFSNGSDRLGWLRCQHCFGWG